MRDDRGEQTASQQEVSTTVGEQADEGGQSPFESIRHSDENGEFWLARELMPLLEYSAWQDFDHTIERAIEDCLKSGGRWKSILRVFTGYP